MGSQKIMTGLCFLGSPVPPGEPHGKPLLLSLQSSQNRLSLRTLQQTAAFRISGQEIGEKRRKASGSVRCYFRIRSSILGDSKEVVCEGLDRKTLKGWQCGLVGEVCLRSVSKYRANCSQLRLPSQRPGGKRLAVGHRGSSVGSEGRHSTEALERILHCVHHHCVPALCEELPEPRTMRHSNCDSEELDFEYNKNGRLRRMSVRQQPCRTGRHWLSNLVPVTKAQTDLP